MERVLFRKQSRVKPLGVRVPLPPPLNRRIYNVGTPNGVSRD